MGNPDTGQNECWQLVSHYMAPLMPLFERPGVTDICVNRFDEIFVEENGVMRRVPEVGFSDEATLNTLVNQIANALGQVVDKSTHPQLDGRLPDGTRVCAVLAPVAAAGTNVTFRVFPKKRITGGMLVQNGSLTAGMLNFLKRAILSRANVLVSGSTGSGKTTLLKVLSDFIPKAERVVSVEDTHELKIHSDNHVPLEAPVRRNTAGGRKECQRVDMAFLIKTTLRMRPDRIIVGEIRDAAAAVAFLHAINTGHNVASTIHANGPQDALVRIQTLVAGEGGLPFEVVKAQVRANLHLLVHAERTPAAGRRIVAVTEIADGKTKDLWRWDPRKGAHQKLSEASFDKRFTAFAEALPN